MRIETIEIKPNIFADYAVIDNEDGSTTVMLKSEYDRQQAEQSTPNLPA